MFVEYVMLNSVPLKTNHLKEKKEKKNLKSPKKPYSAS